MVDTRKKKKHIHTAPDLRKAKAEAGRAEGFAVSASCAVAGFEKTSRRTTSRASASTATDAAAKAARRQPPNAAMPVMNMGATAQPRFPERPCTEKAWPNLGCDTRRLSTVKSAGWNTLLPAPASRAAAI